MKRATVPLDDLPDNFREYVRAVADFHEVSTDLPLALALVAASAATRGEWNIFMGEHSYGPPVVWTFTLLPSGERKSSTQRTVFGPLEQIDNANRKRLRERAAAEQEASKKKTSGDLRGVGQYRLKNATVAAMVQRLMMSGGAGYLAEDEGSSLLSLLKDSKESLSDFCQAFDGGTISHDRVGTTAQGASTSREVYRAAMPMSLLAQPGSPGLDLVFDPRAVTIGFPARLLFFVPELFAQRATFHERPLAEKSATWWANSIGALYERAYSLYVTRTATDEKWPHLCTVNAKRLPIDDEGVTLLRAHAQGLKQDTPALEQLDEVFSGPADLSRAYRLREADKVARVAAVLALLDAPNRQNVPGEYVRQSLQLVPALRAHALNAALVVRGLDSTHALQFYARMRKKSAGAGERTFTTRDCVRVSRSSVRTTAELLQELNVLGLAVRDTRPDGRGKAQDVWTFPAAPVDALGVTGLEDDDT